MTHWRTANTNGRPEVGGATFGPSAYDAGRVDLKLPSGSLPRPLQHEFNSIDPIDTGFNLRDLSSDRVTVILLTLLFFAPMILAGIMMHFR